jgi:hypothetical protein
MEKLNYQNLVLEYIKTTDKKFILDRNVLFRGVSVGAIPKTGVFSTSEVITAGTPMWVPFNNGNGSINKIYPNVNLQTNQAIFPFMSSDGSKILEPNGIMINLISVSSQIEASSISTAYNVSPQDNSLLRLYSDFDFIRVAADHTLFNKLDNSGQWVIGHLIYFIIQLDLNGTEYLSMDYLDTKVKYTTFCETANFYLPTIMKTGAYFDKTYINRGKEIYKPLYEKFIKKSNSTSLCH